VLALGNPASSSPITTGDPSLQELWHASPWLGDALHVRGVTNGSCWSALGLPRSMPHSRYWSSRMRARFGCSPGGPAATGA
jgi:hypothetical protein